MSSSTALVKRTSAIVGLTMGGVVLGVLGGLVVQPWRFFQREPSMPESMTVEMRGREYRWQFRYPGPDGDLDTPDDIHAGNELHVPTGTKVDLLVRSDDYVYTLTIPGLKQRQIAIPGRTFTMTIQVAEPGSYEILADPLCGVRLFHDEEMGRIVVELPRDHDAWREKLQ